MRTIPRETTRVTIAEAVTLALLAEKERSGYELLKRAEGSVGYIWAPAKSRLYAVLPRLVDSGLARVRTVHQQRRPDKQLYRLTPAGEHALGAWLEDRSLRSWEELLLKVFFGRFTSQAVLLSHLDSFRQKQAAELDEYLSIEREIAGKPDRRFGYLTLQYGLALMRARLDWIDSATNELSG